jgi:hypothetical protein
MHIVLWLCVSLVVKPTLYSISLPFARKTIIEWKYDARIRKQPEQERRSHRSQKFYETQPTKSLSALSIMNNKTIMEY